MPRNPRIVTKQRPKSKQGPESKFKKAPKNTIWYFEGDLSTWMGPVLTNPQFTMREVALATAIGENFHYNGRARTNLIQFDKRAIVQKVMNNKVLQKEGVKTSTQDISNMLKRLEESGHVALCCHSRNLYYFTDPTK